jgi:hypothetical protein
MLIWLVEDGSEELSVMIITLNGVLPDECSDVVDVGADPRKCLFSQVIANRLNRWL